MSHTEDRPFRCPKCSKAFKTKSCLKLHSETHTTDPEKMVQCELCNKSVKRDVLKHHMMIHTGEKPYLCKICKRSFNNTGTIDKHQKQCEKNFFENPEKLTDCYVKLFSLRL